ncbi:alkylation response protein AidB-like acyl-CoA dehydrogenase [Herbaspirillum sp. Sphag1AN]|uniref:acyl-CoA dehydrogenase family protein n=1 Tax=unclassified Herbaspirillum TaxID=2624150 RepID=UPI00161F2043|nr:MULTISPECIES: acyl-CoA dehydrogenase family protein [unclassified Herbaspirillum]MBB3211862.1 alkylation response protein AidB-like acyl-CoA dehydrogenase [Herbaspirillum sp. Sphag1AN]MBB3244304.1 alkylation response protein AidB-like acyl-CoA dehydrogenase [Herbaspirillum sp. Sphag64]
MTDTAPRIAPPSVNPFDFIDEGLRQWLSEHAESLHHQGLDSEHLIPRLAQAGLFAHGVPLQAGGLGGDARHATMAIAAVAEHSLAAAFAFWGQRAFIEYLLHSPNETLAARWLPLLLSGEHAGATGLSNAMKFLGGIESLQIHAEIAPASAADPDGWHLQGKLAWVTNLRKAGFIAAAAVANSGDQPPMVIAVHSDMPGLIRSADLDLIGLRGSNTAALSLQEVHVSQADLLHEDARVYLPTIRPAFLAMQCGMSIGLARASLRRAQQLAAGRHSTTASKITAVQQALAASVTQLLEGVQQQRFREQAPALFRLRIVLAELTQQAVGLELQAKGGSAYLQEQQDGFARRWTEAAFIPIITPSLTQLQAELQRHTPSSA